MDKNKYAIVITLIFIIGAGVSYLFLGQNQAALPLDHPQVQTLTLHTPPYHLPSAETLDTPTATIPASIGAGTVTVFISGAVYDPHRVFELPYGARVVDVLELAGGATAEADLNRINLAALLTDAQHVIVPALGENLPPAHEETVSPSATTSGLVNLNTASLAELMTLPGIGPALGQNIIDHRTQYGPFTDISQIQQVNRIGAGIFNNIQSLISIQ